MMTFGSHDAEPLEPEVISSWVRELRRRSHELANHITSVDAKVVMLEVKLDERYTAIKEASDEMRRNVADLASKLDGLRLDVTRINTKQVAAIGIAVWVAMNVSRFFPALAH